MNIIFKKIIIHNFMSYGHAEYDFRNRNFCKVVGVNECKEDNAASNGSGKSTLFNALCWVLTDKTAQGISKNLKNLKVDENSCYVTLDFTVDNSTYILTRTYKPAHYLKIVVDGVDQSGKGIKESEAVLQKYLPDLNPNLISSMIILGQGLPNKFTGNTPSGRKEILEKLSKSDFMIDDIKTRIANRKLQLEVQKRKLEDDILQLETKKSTIAEQLQKAQEKKESVKIDRDFDKELAEIEKKIKEVENKITTLADNQASAAIRIEALNTKIQKLTADKTAESLEENNSYNEFYRKKKKKKSTIDASIKSLKTEIARLKNIRDVCPTCGQKIPHVHKPSTESQEAELKTLNENLASITEKYTAYNKEHTSILANIDKKYSAELQTEKNTLVFETISARNLSNDSILANNEKDRLITQKIQVAIDKSNLMRILQELADSITSYNATLKKLDEDLLYSLNEKQKVSDALDMDNKLTTLAIRDFRGFLLKNTIEFINKSAKNYCRDIFKTDAIEFELDGNDINISYCDKPIENLSGGERQKIDLIIQFALRDMMFQLLNFNCNIIVLDEILDNLDVVGSNEILNFISKKLNDVESIFIISHNINELEIPCDSQLTVIKSIDGISYIK